MVGSFASRPHWGLVVLIVRVVADLNPAGTFFGFCTPIPVTRISPARTCRRRSDASSTRETGCLRADDPAWPHPLIERTDPMRLASPASIRTHGARRG